MQVLTYDQVAKRAGVTRRTIERLIAVGEGPAVVHVTKRRRGVLEDDADRWLLARRRPAPSDAAEATARKTA